MRARPPPADDFIDIFQKFKFAFNLLVGILCNLFKKGIHVFMCNLKSLRHSSLSCIHIDKACFVHISHYIGLLKIKKKKPVSVRTGEK